MLERILVPLDGSPSAEAILSQLGHLLRRKDSEVLLLRVMDLPPILRDLESVSYLPSAREEAENYVKSMQAGLSGKGAKVRGQVIEGAAAEAILEVARKENAGMIAMTTHGRSGLGRWTMGSVAEKVARSSDVPVLIVRSFREAAGGGAESLPAQELPFRRILVPVDGSPTSLAVVGAAKELALLFNSEVLVLHVWPPVGPLYVLPGVPVFSTNPKAIFSAPPADQDKVTAQVDELFRQAGLNVTRLSTDGDVAAEIIDRSKTMGADLIALGTHGRSGVSRWVLGSVAERVLRHASVPVLLVRTPSSTKPQR